MTKRDWLIVGLKLLGVYFAVHGFVSAGQNLSTSLMYVNDWLNVFNAGFGPGQEFLWRIVLSQSAALLPSLVAAFFLIRHTRFCLLFVYPWAERDETETMAP